MVTNHKYKNKRRGSYLKMKPKIKLVYPKFEDIKDDFCRIDCTITLEDFNTSTPNPRRVDATEEDIGRYLSWRENWAKEGVTL